MASNNFSPTSYIVIDDANSAIDYTGPWNATSLDDQNARMQVWNYSPIFNTVHVVSSLNASLSYSFTGTGASLVFIQVGDLNRAYTVKCWLDGILLSTTSGHTKSGQREVFCPSFGLFDGATHNLSLSLSVLPQDHANTDQSKISGIALDYILVQPSQETSIMEEDTLLSMIDVPSAKQLTSSLSSWVMIDTDPDLSGITGVTSSDWAFDASNGFHTSTDGSQFNLSFTGTSIQWFGYATELSMRSDFSCQSLPTFAIDGGSPTEFPCLTFGNSTVSTLWNGSQLLLFQTPDLPYERHNLAVVSPKPNGTMPLTLQSLVIRRSQKASQVTSQPPNATAPSPTQSSVETLTRPPRLQPGAVAGAIAGGLVFLAILFLGGYILGCRRREQRRSANATAAGGVVLQPFCTTADGGNNMLPGKSHGRPNIVMQELEPPAPTKWSRASRDEHSPRNPLASPVSAPQEREVLDETAEYSAEEDTTPAQSRIYNVHDHFTAVVASSMAIDVREGPREEDSGLRLVEEHSSIRLPVHMDPPVYTMN